ncbi:hypothetical protein GCM10009127_25760 [Alteraurantiacibacter aestuarii]|uniref:hypothetical protein n=1 Tax=Alteraurantiacibacter aestuarii TaxID=650004 RepID=UPI0031D87048
MCAVQPAIAQDADLVTVPAVPRDYQPGTTEWGDPDLRGTWPIDHLNFTPLQRPPEQGMRYFLNDEEFAQRSAMLAARGEAYAGEIEDETIGMGHWVEPGDANRRTSFVIDPADGRLPPLTAEGVRLSATKRSSYLPDQTYDTPLDFDTWDRCITRGLPASMFPFNYNNGIRIFQAPGMVAIQMEMVHEVRIIPLGEDYSAPSGNSFWLGQSRGHWEDGNTLVVETSNFNAQGAPVNVGTWGSPPGNNTPQSTQAHMTERFTITGPDTIIYEVTYTDPVIFTAPWTARLDWQRDEAYTLFEYACHEGNVQIRGYINSSRAQREQARGQNRE